MELLDGTSLGERLTAGNIFDFNEACLIWEQLISGVEFLHSKQLTHGDLHAENVMLVEGAPKIIDIDYSHENSLRLLSTLSKAGQISQDVSQLGWLCREILRKTNMPGATMADHDMAMRIAGNLSDLKSVIGSIKSVMTEHGKQQHVGKPQTESEIAIQAIQTGSSDVEARIRDFMHSLVGKIVAISPDLSVNSQLPVETIDDHLVRAIEQSVPIIAQFIAVIKELGDFKLSAGIVAMVKGFQGLLERYELPRQFSGSFRDIEFDFFKFIGAEMMTIMVAVLLRAEQLDLIQLMFKETIYVTNVHGRGRADIVDIFYTCSTVHLLQHRNNRLKLGRFSVHADMLNSRYTTPPLNQLIDFGDFAAADFLLYLFRQRWTPQTFIYAHDVPRFLIEAKRRAYADRLAAALGIVWSEIEPLVLQRLNSLEASRHRYHLALTEFDRPQLKEIGTI